MSHEVSGTHWFDPKAYRKPWDYLPKAPRHDAPISDNPSGLYCKVCREAGIWHCNAPEYCGEMEPMK